MKNFENLPAVSRKRKYLRSKGMICPFCGDSGCVTGEAPEVFDDQIDVPAFCSTCEKHWTDVYKLADVEFPKKQNRGVKVGSLKPGTFFKPFDCNTSFLFDEEKRFTRLWDASYVDGFFADTEAKVKVITPSRAAKLAADYRKTSRG
jgi:hypothetical protein